MKEYHFRKYEIDDMGSFVLVKTPKEDYQIPKDKILGVFQLKYWNTSKVRWYHKVFFGLLFLAFTLITFNILTTWKKKLKK